MHVTTIKRAVSLLFLDIAKGVDAEYQTYTWEELLSVPELSENEEHFHQVQTVSGSVAIPKVVALLDYDQIPQRSVKFSRSHVFLRDQHTCQYCAKKLSKQKLNLDHVLPRSQGGKTTWENIVASCHPCNRTKGGRTPEQAGMPLLKKPRKPMMNPLFMQAQRSRNLAWLPFLVK